MSLDFRVLAETIPHLVWSARADGVSDYYNTRFLEYLGRSPAEMQGWAWTDTLHSDDRQRSSETWIAACSRGTEYRIEYRIRRGSDGLYRWHEGRALPLRDAAGNIVRWFGTCTDIEDRKVMEEDLRASEGFLRESDRIKSEFIATASHEFRTPLAIIQGYSELLLGNDSFSAEQQMTFLRVIHDKALALEKIVNELLDVSRVETGRIICLHVEEGDIVEEIRQVVSQFRQKAPDRRFSVSLPEEEVLLAFDKAKMLQVLENLLSNAVKFSPRDGEIAVEATLGDGCCQVMVADQGVGISPENQTHVFDKYYRADATDTAVPGLGIGLYLVKKIVEAHLGRVWVESVPGRGSRFFFTLPARNG